jgi:hypothetical protein
MIIPPVRPHWSVYLAAVLVVALGAPYAGIGPAAIVAALVVASAGIWRCVALLGYIAGALTPDGDDE